VSKKEDDSNGADPSEPGRRRAALPARPKERGRSASLLDDGKLDLDADAPPLALPDSLELDTSELERDFDDVERPALAPSPPAASDEAPLGPHALVGSRAEGPQETSGRSEVAEAFSSVSSASLELDLEGLEAEGILPSPSSPPREEPPKEDVEEFHDAWTVDRMARKSVPPASGGMSSRPPPAPGSSPAYPRAAPPAREGAADALDLVDRSRPSSVEIDLPTEMVDRYALGDFTGSLRAAELLLGRDPDDENARAYAEASKQRLEQIYSSRIGPLDRVPTVTVPEGEIRWLGLDHRAGFLLSRIDGTSTFEEVIDMSGMPRLEALKTMVELLDAGAISRNE